MKSILLPSPVPRRNRRSTEPATKRLSRPRIQILGLCVLLSLAAWARADSVADALAAEQLSVRDLMRLDTELALRQARKKLDALEGQSRAPRNELALPASEPRLIAIYGVGAKLLAEVRVGDENHVYLRGHPFPVGSGKRQEGLYVLQAMDGRCVKLQREGEARRLCLSGSARSKG